MIIEMIITPEDLAVALSEYEEFVRLGDEQMTAQVFAEIVYSRWVSRVMQVDIDKRKKELEGYAEGY